MTQREALRMCSTVRSFCAIPRWRIATSAASFGNLAAMSLHVAYGDALAGRDPTAQCEEALKSAFRRRAGLVASSMRAVPALLREVVRRP